MQRYGDRLLSFWQDREAETGVDVETGRELSEAGKKRAKERSEEQSRLEAKSKENGESTEKDQASERMEVDQPNIPQGGDKESELESHPKDPAQPPPDPSETASAPLEAVDATPQTETNGTTQSPPAPKHASTAPLPISSSSSSDAPSSPSTCVKTPNNGVQVDSPNTISTPNGTRTKERSSSIHTSTPQRSVSFSRGNAGGIQRGWGSGEQGAVAVSGT